jgi:hypothetical protein
MDQLRERMQVALLDSVPPVPCTSALNITRLYLLGFLIICRFKYSGLDSEIINQLIVSLQLVLLLLFFLR